MNKYLSEYPEFIKKFNTVGTNVVFHRNDGYTEYVSTGFADLENKIPSHKDSIYRIASISKLLQ